ncbi:17494_t:CDS:2, partial [Funneliformis geosporum]
EVYMTAFTLLHNDINKGNITELKERYAIDHKADLQAEKLDEREISLIFDIKHLKQLDIILKEFHKKFNKIIPLTCVNEELVDNREALIVYVYVPEETPVNLPSEFMEYSTLISISSSRYLPDACTLGESFQNTEEHDKKLLLTTKHGFEKNDRINISLCAKLIRYHFLGANPIRQFLDYAFCKIENDHEIPKTGSNITIKTS